MHFFMNLYFEKIKYNSDFEFIAANQSALLQIFCTYAKLQS